MLTSVCPTLQDRAQVHEAEQSPRLQGQVSFRGAARRQRAADGAAPAAEHPAGHALPAQPVPGPGEAMAWQRCDLGRQNSFWDPLFTKHFFFHLLWCLAAGRREGGIVCGSHTPTGVSLATPLGGSPVGCRE